MLRKKLEKIAKKLLQNADVSIFLYYVAIGGALLINTEIHLIVFNRLGYREIELVALTLMTSSKARAPELRMITRDSY